MRARLGTAARWRVGSAGTLAVEGLPASSLARQAAAELGLDLGTHRSRAATPALVQAAGLVVAMGPGHFDQLVAHGPQARDKIFLLRRFAPRADGLEIADPAGGTLDSYRQCRDAIKACLPRLAAFLDALA